MWCGTHHHGRQPASTTIKQSGQLPQDLHGPTHRPPCLACRKSYRWVSKLAGVHTTTDNSQSALKVNKATGYIVRQTRQCRAAAAPTTCHLRKTSQGGPCHCKPTHWQRSTQGGEPSCKRSAHPPPSPSFCCADRNPTPCFIQQLKPQPPCTLCFNLQPTHRSTPPCIMQQSRATPKLAPAAAKNRTTMHNICTMTTSLSNTQHPSSPFRPTNSPAHPSALSKLTIQAQPTHHPVDQASV